MRTGPLTEASLDIVYRPVWPDHDPIDPTKPLPSLDLGATATVPANGLPAIRGQSSLRILYRQSIATAAAGTFSANLNAQVSVVLYDPTRAKTVAPVTLPGGVRRESYQGRLYFPALPPHLAERLYLTAGGALTLEGHFEEEAAGQPHLQLNVLRGPDLAAVYGLCPTNDPGYATWTNAVSTDANILTQAGHRWEGDVALNGETIDNYGLIEIYETLLRRSQSLSVNAAPPVNYGPANDALLLAAGYLSELYMLLGDEARADAANPTIGIGTKDRTYGEIATALFSFKGQVPSLLEEELALLRGRDDFLQPAVSTAPYYNRMVWNYTRGINSGEVIYALNYSILDQDADGVVDAADAAKLFPQGHGDAYGHHLTALTGFYTLLVNPSFDWVPSTEAVNVLGVPVQVGYQHERQFAAAAAAVARTGKQAANLTWRLDFEGQPSGGWENLSLTNANAQSGQTKFWGMDHWAVRTGQGAYLHWLVGNAILPAVDNDPAHPGIQKIDRTTGLGLQELVSVAEDLQSTVDNAVSLQRFPGWWTQSNSSSINDILAGTNRAEIIFHYEGTQRAKPSSWPSVRAAPGKLQVAGTEIMRRQHELL